MELTSSCDGDLEAVPQLTSPGAVRGEPGEERGSDLNKSCVPMPRGVPQLGHDGHLGEIRSSVTQLSASIVSCHRETVRRVTAVENCPSSNLHHFVQQVPHTRHEYSPPTDNQRRYQVKRGEFIIEQLNNGVK